MEFLQLQYFQKAARLQNITKAAKELNISQPSLSIMISRLEEELHTDLFDRKGRRIQLNPYGQVVLKHVDAILSERSAAVRHIQNMKEMNACQVSYYATGILLVSQISTSFFMAYPNYRLKQTLGNASDAIQAVLEGKVDFAFTIPVACDPRLESKLLCQDKMVVYVEREHPLVQKGKVAFSDIAEEKWLSPPFYANESIGSLEQFIGRYAGVTPQVVFVGDNKAVQELILQKQGIALGMLSAQHQYDMTRIRIVEFEQNFYSVMLGLSWNKANNLSPAAEVFRDFVINYFEKNVSIGNEKSQSVDG